MPESANSGNVVDLTSAVEDRLKKVHTQSLDISFNELLDMYKSSELDISPDYQRLFQWSEGSRSRFIESLLLEMPVPPIFVIEGDDGKYMLIDGLQRISSYLHLRGELEAGHLDPPVQRGDNMVLTDCDIVKELNGKTFEDLGTALQIRLKRAFVRVEVVRKGSNPHFKYYMFKRLNTGGQLLTDQQIRNCTIRLLDPRFNDFIIKLSKESVFRDCISTISQRRFLEAFDQELVLRFFALKNYREQYKPYLGDFLTEYMEAVSDPDANRGIQFNYDTEEQVFMKTFTLLKKTLGDYAFSYSIRGSGTLVKGFSANNYEAFTVGLQAILDQVETEDPTHLSLLEAKFREIKLDDAFIDLTAGGGKNSPGPLRQRIQFIEDRLQGAL
ncbi:MAG: DUF262 domain-containing protein [Planctomycetota bacterium]|jgi:hypothetical protein